MNPDVLSCKPNLALTNMSTVPVTTDTLPSNVPKLDVKGTNWLILAFHFQTTVEAKDMWGGATSIGSWLSRHSPAPCPLTKLRNTKKWCKNEGIVKHLLIQWIPDSTALKIQKLDTVKEMWREIKWEYTEKGAYAQMDLCTQFLESRMPKGGNVCQFLDDLHTKWEELASVGVDIDKKDYCLIIIQSLSLHFANFALTQLAIARLYATSKTIKPDILISLISEEAERQKTKHTSRSDVKDCDEAMAVMSSSRSCGHGWGCGSYHRTQLKQLCWNCGSDQHLAVKCDKLPKEGEKKSTHLDSIHAVIDDTAWSFWEWWLTPWPDVNGIRQWW